MRTEDAIKRDIAQAEIELQDLRERVRRSPSLARKRR